MLLQRQQLSPRIGIEDLACPIIAASYEPIEINQLNQPYLSPDLLKAQFVRGSKCALRTLKRENFYSWFSICFSINSTREGVTYRQRNLLSMSFLSWGFLDSEMRGSSSRIWSINLSMSVL
jgi:hypothetical protein